MKAAERKQIAAQLAVIYHEFNAIADRLDPERKHQDDAANAMDRMVSAARYAHYHLVARFPE